MVDFSLYLAGLFRAPYSIPPAGRCEFGLLADYHSLHALCVARDRRGFRRESRALESGSFAHRDQSSLRRSFHRLLVRLSGGGFAFAAAAMARRWMAVLPFGERGFLPLRNHRVYASVALGSPIPGVAVCDLDLSPKGSHYSAGSYRAAYGDWISMLLDGLRDSLRLGPCIFGKSRGCAVSAPDRFAAGWSLCGGLLNHRARAHISPQTYIRIFTTERTKLIGIGPSRTRPISRQRCSLRRGATWWWWVTPMCAWQRCGPIS